MRNKNIISMVTRAYGLIPTDALLKFKPFRRAYISAYFQYKKFFEDPFWRLARKHPELFRDGDILDIGANIGYTACVFAQVMESGARVFAFEPDRPSYKLLKEVVLRKNLSAAIEVFNTAVGNYDGDVDFWHNERHPADHRVVTKQFRETGAETRTFSTIPITTVDTFVANRNLRRVSFIKIDVQGYEWAVCQGMKNTLDTFRNLCICLEYSPEAMVQLGFESEQLLDFFRSRGYALYILGNKNLKPLIAESSINLLSEEMDYVDLLFSKREIF